MTRDKTSILIIIVLLAIPILLLFYSKNDEQKKEKTTLMKITNTYLMPQQDLIQKVLIDINNLH
jgi:hypothetical protein